MVHEQTAILFITESRWRCQGNVAKCVDMIRVQHTIVPLWRCQGNEAKCVDMIRVQHAIVPLWRCQGNEAKCVDMIRVQHAIVPLFNERWGVGFYCEIHRH